MPFTQGISTYPNHASGHYVKNTQLLLYVIKKMNQDHDTLGPSEWVLLIPDSTIDPVAWGW